jgi:hypothetical protein
LTVENTGDTTAVKLTFPEDPPAFETYYKYRSTFDNQAFHWYAFICDSQTGTGARFDNTNHIRAWYAETL